MSNPRAGRTGTAPGRERPSRTSTGWGADQLSLSRLYSTTRPQAELPAAFARTIVLKRMADGGMASKQPSARDEADRRGNGIEGQQSREAREA